MQRSRSPAVHCTRLVSPRSGNWTDIRLQRSFSCVITKVLVTDPLPSNRLPEITTLAVWSGFAEICWIRRVAIPLTWRQALLSSRCLTKSKRGGITVARRTPFSIALASTADSPTTSGADRRRMAANSSAKLPTTQRIATFCLLTCVGKVRKVF